MRRLADVFSPDVSVEAQGEKQQGREISCQNTRSELRQLMPLTDCCHGENGEDASPARPTNRGVPSDDRPMATRVLARLIFCIVSLAERVGEAAALFFRGRSTLRNYGREASFVDERSRSVERATMRMNGSEETNHSRQRCEIRYEDRPRISHQRLVNVVLAFHRKRDSISASRLPRRWCSKYRFTDDTLGSTSTQHRQHRARHASALAFLY